MARTRKLITDLDKLRKPVKPLRFITSDGTMEQEEGNKIIEQLKNFLDKNPSLLSVAAPQLGINSRVFCIKFDDTIKSFINPVITKKSNYKIAPETFSSMPGKEILISRPEEVSIVYYTDGFKYEDNKLLGPAARIFDQQIQLLDGVLPDELGLVSDVEADGSLAELNQEEIDSLIEVYKKYIDAKAKALNLQVSSSEEFEKEYKKLKFTEDVVNGRAQVIQDNPGVKLNRAERRAAKKFANKLSKKGAKK